MTLRWYFNGLPLNNDDHTLTLTNVTLSNAGVYQCLWDGFFDFEREMISWAFSVQVPSKYMFDMCTKNIICINSNDPFVYGHHLVCWWGLCTYFASSA